MAWDKNELVVLGLTLTCATILTALGKIDSQTMENSLGVIIGYAAGRIFNHAQGKEK